MNASVSRQDESSAEAALQEAIAATEEALAVIERDLAQA